MSRKNTIQWALPVAQAVFQILLGVGTVPPRPFFSALTKKDKKGFGRILWEENGPSESETLTSETSILGCGARYSFLQHAGFPEGANRAADRDLLDGLQGDCSARALNTFVHRALDRIEAGRPYLLDCHLVPQAEYLASCAHYRFTELLRVFT